MHTCPDCGAQLTPEEQQLQECWTCGWPGNYSPIAELSNIPPGFFPDAAISSATGAQTMENRRGF